MNSKQNAEAKAESAVQAPTALTPDQIAEVAAGAVAALSSLRIGHGTTAGLVSPF